MSITYTFPPNCPIAKLANQTVTGGKPCTLPDGSPGVDFGIQLGGIVKAKLAGKTDLQAQVNAYYADMAARKAALDSIGWPQYQAVQRRAYNARAAYDRASEHGYPVRQAAAMRAADEALDATRVQYPVAAAYAKAESYSMAENYAKAGAGREAMEAIESGADPMAAVAAMESEWSAAAERMVQNA